MIHKWNSKTVGNKTSAIVCGPISEVKDLIQQLRTHYSGGVYVTQANHDTGMLSAKIVMYEEELLDEATA